MPAAPVHPSSWRNDRVEGCREARSWTVVGRAYSVHDLGTTTSLGGSFMTTNGRILSALYLQPRNADYDTVLEFFRSERIMEKSQENGGLIDASITVPLSGSGPMLVI